MPKSVVRIYCRNDVKSFFFRALKTTKTENTKHNETGQAWSNFYWQYITSQKWTKKRDVFFDWQLRCSISSYIFIVVYSSSTKSLVNAFQVLDSPDVIDNISWKLWESDVSANWQVEKEQNAQFLVLQESSCRLSSSSVLLFGSFIKKKIGPSWSWDQLNPEWKSDSQEYSKKKKNGPKIRIFYKLFSRVILVFHDDVNHFSLGERGRWWCIGDKVEASCINSICF